MSEYTTEWIEKELSHCDSNINSYKQKIQESIKTKDEFQLLLYEYESKKKELLQDLKKLKP